MTKRFLLCKAQYEQFKQGLKDRANVQGIGQDESALRNKAAELLGGNIDAALGELARADDDEDQGQLWFELSVPRDFKAALKHLRYVEYINGTPIQKTIMENILAEWEDALKAIENHAEAPSGRWPSTDQKTTQTYWNRLDEDNKARAEKVYNQGPDSLTLNEFIKLLAKQKAPISPIKPILKAVDGGISGDVLWDKFEWYFNSDIYSEDIEYSLFIHAMSNGLSIYDCEGIRVDSGKLVESCLAAKKLVMQIPLKIVTLIHRLSMFHSWRN